MAAMLTWTELFDLIPVSNRDLEDKIAYTEADVGVVLDRKDAKEAGQI